MFWIVVEAKFSYSVSQSGTGICSNALAVGGPSAEIWYKRIKER